MKTRPGWFAVPEVPVTPAFQTISALPKIPTIEDLDEDMRTVVHELQTPQTKAAVSSGRACKETL
jgi:hypothetical protein